MGRSLTQRICWCTKAPNLSHTPSTIACRRLAYQQYQAAFFVTASATATR